MNIVCLNRLNRLLYFILVSVIVISCRQGADNEKIALFVAAGLAEAVDSLANFYSVKNGVEFEINAASSGTLAKQIEQGAPATIYFSANVKWMEFLFEKRIICDTCHKEIAGNQLVLIKAKTDSDAIISLSSIGEITQRGNKLAMGTPEHVPAGKYAKEALVKLGVFTDLKSALIFTKDVRAALILTEMGEAKYAIVYKTDALSSHKVEIIEKVADSLHSPIILSVGLVQKINPKANEFYKFLSSERAKNILKSFGFKMLE